MSYGHFCQVSVYIMTLSTLNVHIQINTASAGLLYSHMHTSLLQIGQTEPGCVAQQRQVRFSTAFYISFFNSTKWLFHGFND